MKGKSRYSAKSITSKIVAYAKEQVSGEKAKLLTRFIKLYYSHAYSGDLEARSVVDLYGTALSHWELLQSKRPNELKINVFNPHFEQHGWQSTHTIIQIVTDDMPFLIDSVRMELDRMGFTTHLMIHTGGIKVLRNDRDKLINILAYKTKNIKAKAESPICFEIDRQTDPKVLEEIRSNLMRVLGDVAATVKDWAAMKQRMCEVLKKMCAEKMPQPKEEVNESIAFLEWLLQDHFTFLGARDYEVVGQGTNKALRLLPESGLGVLRDDTHSRVFRQFSELPERARALMLSTDHILIISKTNTRATVHRSAYTDYIGVKIFNEKGELMGERRFIGLYTSAAYSSTPKAIPFLRQKVAQILEMSSLPKRSHGGKDLMHILTTLPRDDFFQATIEDLYQIATGILHLQDRRKIRLFVREDAYGRFVSCLVYIPRENFNTDVLLQIQDILIKSFHGVEATFDTAFSGTVLARIHFLIRIDTKKPLKYDLREIEQKLIEVGRSWRDVFKESALEYFGEEKGNIIFASYRHAFPASYREVFAARNAVYDIEHMESLNNSDQLAMSFYRPLGAPKDVIRFKLFRAEHTVPLSDALPMLENMGLRVVGEQPYEIIRKDGRNFWINDFNMTYSSKEPSFDVEEIKPIFQEAFNSFWMGDAENDALNRLVLEAQLTWREISMIRAYTKYLRQVGFTFSQEYIAETIVNNPSIARLLVELFKARFDPSIKKERKQRAQQLEELIYKRLDEVAILDEDRILRRILDLIHATLRTNYFQKGDDKQPKSQIAFKLDPHKVPDVPLPLPRYEIYVYSPRFEGVHLRMAKVARGGIRWSDRREDFRTEVLGLMKAQQVKNAVIVPSGAKGGFVPKNLPTEGSREEVMEEGIACYKGFINGLLDVVDNLEGEKVIYPKRTICYDGADAYLVVAADKGTATFSDIANSIAMDEKFWLGDAFASGGSTGYDHKKMAITARGAWVSAERQFQELGINVDDTEITVVGIGDMSGDVFGNGLLLSKHIKLIAAFNHQHIFLDPNPNPAISFAERKRLFELPRSTWEDYDPSLISKGGGVFRRTVKAIKLSPQVKKVLGVDKDVMYPAELISEILKAPVDLIWNGGIGTYVKSSAESNADVGDRANDALRVNGSELRARVVCEGGNLGFTQLARIEYELNGGNINTDFIDNSAGVDCSDHEVNIKILLDSVVQANDLTVKQRNQLMARMTDEVANLVLQNNYHQNEAISLAANMSSLHINLYRRYLDALEQSGKINRELEFLPDDKTLLDRKAAELGLTRPELSVLFAYSKIILEEDIRKSELTNDPYLAQLIKAAFPTPLRKKYQKQMSKHRLRKEIVSTQLSNRLVSDMGITFTYQMYDETGAPVSAIVKAYAAVREIFHLPEILADIESLDYKVEALIQHHMQDEITRLIRRAIRWFLRNRRDGIEIVETIREFAKPVAGLYTRLPNLLLGSDWEQFEAYRDELIELKVPAEIAARIASASPMYHALNIIESASVCDLNVYHVAKIYFILAERLNLAAFREQINAYTIHNRWSALAKASLKADMDTIQQELTMGVLKWHEVDANIDSCINAWFDKHSGLIERWNEILSELRGSGPSEFDILSVAIRELSDLAQASVQAVIE